MSHIFLSKVVLYQCTCGSQRPITRIYFCRHCLELRCGECVSHEVDSHYCHNCLEYMPSPEARLKRNKCANCFNCPSCMHTLSARATSILVPSSEDPEKVVPKKVYYMVCGFCRWTSRDVGIPDQITATGSWQEKENEHSARIHALMEHYKVLAQEERRERENKKLNQRATLLLHDKYGITNVIAKKLSGLNPIPVHSKHDAPLSLPEATSDIEILPEKYYTEPLNLATICTLKQRLFQPQFQPVETSELFPKQKYLLIKRSQRCKKCDHNLSKPEYNPASIKFKIQLAAFYHIPDLRLKCFPVLQLEKKCLFEITLCNPTAHVIKASFLPFDGELPSDMSEIILPTCEFILSARDDTAEFDDSTDTQQFNDNPKIVTFRKSNKIGINLHVIPRKQDVSVTFKLQHSFINTVVQLQGVPQEPKEVLLTHILRVNLGSVATE